MPVLRLLAEAGPGVGGPAPPAGTGPPAGTRLRAEADWVVAGGCGGGKGALRAVLPEAAALEAVGREDCPTPADVPGCAAAVAAFCGGAAPAGATGAAVAAPVVVVLRKNRPRMNWPVDEAAALPAGVGTLLPQLLAAPSAACCLAAPPSGSVLVRLPALAPAGAACWLDTPPASPGAGLVPRCPCWGLACLDTCERCCWGSGGCVLDGAGLGEALRGSRSCTVTCNGFIVKSTRPRVNSMAPIIVT